MTFKDVQHTLQKMVEEAKEKGEVPEHIKGGSFFVQEWLQGLGYP